MGYSRFDGVKRVEGSSMPFENYLKQINLLYPNLPDIYIKYLELVYKFNAAQLERLLKLNEHDLADAIVTSIFNALQNVKNTDNDVFNSFIQNYFYQERAIDLFDIEIPEIPELPEIPECPLPDLLGYCETKTTIFKQNKIIYFSQPYTDVVSVALSHPSINNELLVDYANRYVAVQLSSDLEIVDTEITLIAICVLESEVVANV